MRITVDKDDHAFDPLFDYESAMVFFDNQLISNCVTADDELGMVLCYADDGPDGIEYEWFQGDVRIVILKEEVEDECSGLCGCSSEVSSTASSVCGQCGGIVP